MEVKSKIKKLGLLSQAVLASTVCLMPVGANAAVQNVAGDIPLGVDGDWVFFTTDNAIQLDNAAKTLGTSNGTGAPLVPAGYSAYPGTVNFGKIDFQANVGPIPGLIGDATRPINQVLITGANRVAQINGAAVLNGDVIYDAAANQQLTVGSNITTANVTFANGAGQKFIADTAKNNITITATDIIGGGGVGGSRGQLIMQGPGTVTVNSTVGAGNLLDVVSTKDNVVANISNDITATNINLTNTSTLNVNEDALNFTGDLTAANTARLNIFNNTFTVTGTAAHPVNTIIALQASDADTGHLEGTVNVQTAAGTKLEVTPIGYLTNGKAIEILDDSAGAGGINAIDAANITGNSAVLGFTTAKNANNLNLVIARNAYDSGVHNLNGQAAGLGAALEADGAAGRLAAGNADFEAFVGNVDRLATSAEVATALSTAAPTVNSAIVSTAHEIGERVLTNIDNRITLVRSGERSYNTGMSAGDTTEGWGVWGELFGSDFTQDKRNNIEGYDGNLWGVTLGVDWMVDNATLLGLAATYSTTDVDHDLANNTLDIDSFQGSLYGSFTCNPWYVQGMLGVAHHDYDQTRNIIVGANTMGRALGDYKAWEWLANAEAGYIWTDGAWNVIPSASLRYSHLSIDDYTETGASGFNLKVRNEDVNAFVAGLGLKVQYNNVYGGSRIVPEAHVGAFYDFIADRQETSSNIFGTGTAFNSKGFDPAHDSYEVGVGLNIYTERNSIFSINYDYRFKSDFHSHNGFVKLRYQW